MNPSIIIASLIKAVNDSLQETNSECAASAIMSTKAGVNILTDNEDYKVYLDKFVSLPHLPIAADCTDKNPRKTKVTPKMNHTGIRSKFEPRVKRPVYTSGDLTNEFIATAHVKGRATARAIMKAELALVRSKFEKSTYLEDRLLQLEERRHIHDEVCNQQLTEEKSFLRSMGSTEVSKSYKKKSKKASTPGSARPHRVFNEETLVRCILDTTDMSMCSAKSNRDDDGSMSTTSTMRRKKINTERWDAEALKLAHGVDDDMYSLSDSI